MGANEQNYDFCGWATKNDLKCSDGRIIRRGAFKHCDGTKVPLVWNHVHDNPSRVLGHALLKDCPEGVKAYCSFNNTAGGLDAKETVKHGDIVALSIYANQLRQNGPDVVHGSIREVSLVLAGANPGAFIDTVIEHSEDLDGSANITFICDDSIIHSESEEVVEESAVEEPIEEVVEHAEPEKKENDMADEKTVEDVINTMTEEQQFAVQYLVGAALESAKKGDKEDMKQNAFDQESQTQENVISHSEVEAMFTDAKRYGTLRESALAHGIADIDILYPDAKAVNTEPEFIKRDDDWVSDVINGTHKSPFAKIKSIFADITEDEARAKGYLADRTHRDSKGNLVDAEGNRVMKKEEVFGLLKRTTSPATIYKKQRIDRDDLIDIKDLDTVAFIKKEMRMMLNEEIARAILIGDGRSMSDSDKINEQNIRPIWTDEPLFTIHVEVPVTASTTEDQRAKAAIRAIIKSRKKYKGSGKPAAYITEDLLTDMLLLEDVNGRVIYDTEEKLKTALRVSKIVSVPVMENKTRQDTDGNTFELGCLIVNLNDYNVGTDKKGEVTLFEDFDINFNAMLYMMETRFSGALIRPYSAMAVEFKTAASTPGPTPGPDDQQ